MSKRRQGLVPVKKMAVRDGKPYLTTVYVRPGQAKKVTSKTFKIPDFDIKDSKQLQNESNKMKKIKDPAEKQLFREALLGYLEKDLNASWKKSDHEGINYMRALMAAKAKLDGKTKKKKDDKPTATPATKADARDLVNDLKKKHGDKLLGMLKKEGISWKENNHTGINNMRAYMALRQFLEDGGTFDGVSLKGEIEPKKKEQPKPVVPVSEKRQKEPPKGTFDHDYFHATPVQRAIGMITGIMPVDEAAEKYLLKNLQNGDYDVQTETVKVLKYYEKEVVEPLRRRLTHPTQPFEGQFVVNEEEGGSSYKNLEEFNRRVFKDMGAEKEYDEYIKHRKRLKDKYGPGIMDIAPDKHQALSNAIDYLEKDLGLQFDERLKYEDVRRKFYNDIEKALKSRSKAEALFDRLGIYDALKVGTYEMQDSPTMFGSLLGLSTTGNISKFHEFQDRLIREIEDEASMVMTSGQDVANLLERGDISKLDVLRGLQKALKDSSFSEFSDDRTQNYPILDNVQRGRSDLLQELHFIVDGRKQKVSGNSVKKDIREILRTKSKFTSEEGRWISLNLATNFLLVSADNRANKSQKKSLADLKSYQGIPLDQFRKTRDKVNLVATHVELQRIPEKRRDSARKKIEATTNRNLMVQLLKEGNVDRIESDVILPDAKEARKRIKAVIETATKGEQTNIVDKIQSSHDRRNHGSFEIRTHNVFKIRQLEVESKFKKIDEARNNTHMLYHGTDNRASQLILGESGQFKVMKGDKVKTGSMLGYGIYLANVSSKSAQYIGSNFARSAARGVLFLCNSSLGKVQTSTRPGFNNNQKFFDSGKADTVYMTTPHVLNDEWCVAEAEAVLPQYMVEITRVPKK